MPPTRDQVYEFANGCIEAGEEETAAEAVICFEWLQRPENVIARHIKWTDYRNPKDHRSFVSNITRQGRSFCIR